MRAPGMTWFRLPLFIWSHLRHQSHPGARDAGSRHHAADGRRRTHLSRRHLRSRARRRSGASFSTCSGSIRIPPSTSWCCPAWPWSANHSRIFRKPIFGYKFVAFSSIAIAVIGFLVWGHHMFVAGQSVYSAMAFSLSELFVAVPSAIKVFNWTATMYKGSVSWTRPCSTRSASSACSPSAA